MKDGSAGRSVGDFTNEDGYWKLLIDRRMYDRERWRRQEQRAGGRQVLELMRRLGVSVTFVDMMSPRERAQLSRRQQRAKGWYDPRTGRVYINLSHHSRGDDVVATFLHEVVAHKGLRELFGKDFDTFLNNVFNNVSEDIRKEIVEMASRRDWDSLTATEEYLALLAQSTDFDDARNRKVWSKVINYFMDLLRKVGITLNRPLTDNELRYILWRSYNRMEQRGVMGLADDMVMRDKLDIDSVLSVAGGEVEPQHGERGLRYSLNRGSRFAPDGTLSILDEKQHKEVRTQNFKDWAGDWERNFLKDFLFEKNPVGEAEGTEFPKGETSLLEQVTEYYKKVCNGIILRKDIGSVLLDSRSVKDCIGHGVNRLKAAAFKVVPNIIESGVIIDSKENWKGRGYSSVTIAAPVLIGKKAYIGIAVVNELKDRDRGDNRFYLHGVVLKENLQSEEFKTGMVTGSKLGDIAKVLKEIVTTKESTKIVGKNGEPLVMCRFNKQMHIMLQN